MIEELVTKAFSSEAATMAFILSTVGPLTYKAPAAILGFGEWAKQKCLYSVEFHFSDSVFIDFNNWLTHNMDSVKFVRSERVESDAKVNRNGTLMDDDEPARNWRFVPSYGNYFMKPKGYPWMLLNRSKDSEKKDVTVPPDIMRVVSFAWNKRKVHKFVNQISEARLSNSEPRLYRTSYNYFTEIGIIHSSIKENLLPEYLKELTQKIQRFLDNREQWIERGFKHKMGVGLYGIPGTGKSELVAYWAKKFGMNVYQLSASDILSSSVDTLSKIPPHSIILLEDIDTMSIGSRSLDDDDSPVPPGEYKKASDDSGAKMSGKAALGELLNAMDGLCSYKDCLIVATTNDISALDPALLRSGRIDEKVEVVKLTPAEVMRYYKAFFPDYSGYHYNEEAPDSMTIADLQKILRGHMNDPYKAALAIGVPVNGRR